MFKIAVAPVPQRPDMFMKIRASDFEKRMGQAYVDTFLMSDIGFKVPREQMELALYKLITLPNTDAQLVRIVRHSRMATRIIKEGFEAAIEDLRGFHQLKLTLAVTRQEQSWALIGKGDGTDPFWARTVPSFMPGQATFAAKMVDRTVRIITGHDLKDACTKTFGNPNPVELVLVREIPLESTRAEAALALGLG